MTLVDRNDYHQFQPLLYQVATSQLPAEDIARPHRTIFRELPDRRGRARPRSTAVDLADRSADAWPTADVVSGSHLVIAAGARPNFFGVPGAAEHAFPLYSVADAERLRLHLQELLRGGGRRTRRRPTARSTSSSSAAARPGSRRPVRSPS